MFHFKKNTVMNSNKNKEIIYRRQFFKSTTKSILPILGTVLLVNKPIFGKALGHEGQVETGCNFGCVNSCSGSCGRSCSYDCSGGCKGGCGGACSYSCQNTCKGTCQGSCRGSCSSTSNW